MMYTFVVRYGSWPTFGVFFI